MSDNKSYRIKINKNEEYADINLNLEQDIDIFEILSLKIDSRNLYKMQTSNYGCVAGRVLANNGIGVPNVKLSIFIAADGETKADSVLNSLYPYENVYDKNLDGVRYNLLTSEELTGCYQAVGTFPSKRLVLDDKNVFEIFDKYYKFTTTTNFAGDYMIFGVPTGSQIIHMDVDLSDIGPILSQSPRDFIYKGYDANMFESPTQFKKSTDLDSLPQIFSQNENVYVYPFWGDPSEMKENDSTGVRISRKDINLSYKFEPTCIFFGSLVSDEKSNGFSEKCVPTDRMGKMDKLTTGEGTIEMIRKTPDGTVESYNIGGTHLIDGDGTWCYQIPMNLDFIRTDENGNIVPSDDPNVGLPTRTSVRFRFSLNDFASDYESNHLCKMLVPNNPRNIEESDSMYAFGTFTPEEEFRDLLWNKVYSVKSYIPRIQKSDTNREKRFTGFKAVNVNASNNPIPYNNIRVDITFMFVLQCAIIHSLLWIVGAANTLIGYTIFVLRKLAGYCVDNASSNFRCISIGDGACPDLEGWYFAPNCKEYVENENQVRLLENTQKGIERKLAGDNDNEIFKYGTDPYIAEPDQTVDEQSTDQNNVDRDEKICVTNKIDYFIKCVELALAQEYEVIQFDFYNDWMNGMLYIPRWFANVKKKRSYLFGLIKTPEKVVGCLESTFNMRRRYTQQCALKYEIEREVDETTDTETVYKVAIATSFGCQEKDKLKKCHKQYGRKKYKIFKKNSWKPGGGIVHSEETMRQEHVYYFRPRDFSIEKYKDGSKYITFFATDIILLGSISDNDMDGVPMISELISSSFKMPTNLAATNMDVAGVMFGAINTINGSKPAFKCNQDGIRGNVGNTVKATLSVAGQTFEDFKNWEAFEEGIDKTNDPDEFPFTEASGIDWGYTGPEQLELKNSYSGDNGEGPSKRFLPGGHFLGLSCFNSETTIISCVNLSRICEIGVNMSRRKEVEKLSVDQTDVFNVPTGVISDYDIYDGDFRSVFATLNHNGLATKEDNLSGRRIYDFIPIYLTGFDGVLSKEEPRKWNAFSGQTPADSGIYADKYFYSRTPEMFDKDYYNFRLGLGNKDKLHTEDVYVVLNSYEGEETGKFYAELPLYNNSFYFYFGLHDGATALDKFYEKFYGQCNIERESLVQEINVETKGVRNGVCNKNGKAIMMVAGLINNPFVHVYNSNGNEADCSIDINGGVITISNLGIGDYYADIDTTLNKYKVDFTIDFDANPSLKQSASKFKEDIEREEVTVSSSAPREGGYIVFYAGGPASNPRKISDVNVVSIDVDSDPSYDSLDSSFVPQKFTVPSQYIQNNTMIYVGCLRPGHYVTTVTYDCDGIEYKHNTYHNIKVV